MANWYCGSTKWTAVTAWAASTAYSVGDLRRQLATPTAGNERVFRCTTAGTSGGSEPTWVITKGATTTDNTAVWTEVTGQAIYNGDGGGSAWGAPFARISQFLTTNWGAAGDTLFVSNNHAETGSAAFTYSVLGTPANPMRIICVDDSVVPGTNLTTVSTGASVTTTGGASGTSGIIFSGSSTSAGCLYCYGITFTAGSSTASGAILVGVASNDSEFVFDTCSFVMAGTGSSGKLSLGPGGSSTAVTAFVSLINCTTKLVAAGQSIFLRAGDLNLTGCSLTSDSTAPTSLFKFDSGIGLCAAKIRACDWSKVTSNLFDLSGTTYATDIRISNCRLGTGVTMFAGPIARKGITTSIENCDSTSTNYRNYKADYAGTVQQETTTVRTGGASDGVTSFSLAMATTANVKIEYPLYYDVIIPNDTSGSSKTVTVECAGASSLTNADFWIEVEYLSSSSYPLSSVSSSRVSNILVSGTTLTTSSESWGGSPANKQKASVTFTPQMKGLFRVRLCFAKVSSTVYVDPAITVT